MGIFVVKSAILWAMYLGVSFSLRVLFSLQLIAVKNH